MMFTMDGFDAYKTYVALKNHFNSKTYDFFKYNGRSRASRLSFEKRNDKYFFHKLAKHKNLIDFLVANLIVDDQWVGDIVNNSNAESNYKSMIKVRESLSYTFKGDLDKFSAPLLENFRVEDAQHPIALKLYLEKEIHLETLIIINDLTGVMRAWNRKINDPVVWPSIFLRCKKYKPFLNYDQEKMKKILVDKIKEEE